MRIFVQIGLCALTALPSFLCAAAEAECSFDFVDDRGDRVDEILTICRAHGRDEGCVDWRPGSGRPKVEKAADHWIEGPSHGPLKARLAPGESQLCSVVVARKAEIAIEFDGEKTRQLPVSFYRTDRDPRLYRPEQRVSLEAPETVRMPAGRYLVSLTERGLAPDLHLLTAEPGSTHKIRHRRADGWSVVIRAVADSASQPLADARVTLKTIPGFDVDARARSLRRGRSDAEGWAIFSGLELPLAGALVEHPDYLDAEIAALSSEEGTFRVFEARLHEGGTLVVRLKEPGEELGVSEEDSKPQAFTCGLFSPETTDEKDFADAKRLVALQTADEATCRASRIPAGSYALKIAVAGRTDAYTVEPVFLFDSQTTLVDVDLRPIRITGRVYRGTEGAPGYEVVFGRAEDYPRDGPVFPVGKPARTDENGDYEVVLWSPGRYLTMVSNETSFAGLPRILDIRADDSIDFEVSSVTVAGRVVDDRGEPRPEAAVRVRLGGLTRSVGLDEKGRFEVPFDDQSEGTAELIATAPGFLDSDPRHVEVREGAIPEPVELLLRSRAWRSGRVLLSSGLPAAGAWVHVHRLGSPIDYVSALERRVVDADGRVDVPREAETLRLFFGGSGCPLGFYDLGPPLEGGFPGGSEANFQIHCGEPGHLILRLVTEDPELKERVPIVLRKEGVTIPGSVLESHLTQLGLPTVTNGHGSLGLVALEAGAYELFHGKMTSALNVAAHSDSALLSRVHLDAGATVELEAVVDRR